MKYTMFTVLALVLTACSGTVPSIQQKMSGQSDETRRNAYSFSDPRPLEPSTTYDSGRF